jgi:hypothetical protein
MLHAQHSCCTHKNTGGAPERVATGPCFRAASCSMDRQHAAQHVGALNLAVFAARHTSTAWHQTRKRCMLPRARMCAGSVQPQATMHVRADVLPQLMSTTGSRVNHTWNSGVMESGVLWYMRRLNQ